MQRGTRGISSKINTLRRNNNKKENKKKNRNGFNIEDCQSSRADKNTEKDRNKITINKNN